MNPIDEATVRVQPTSLLKSEVVGSALVSIRVRRSLAYPSRDELLVPRRGKSPADRLRAGYIVESNGCWRWTGSITTNGYGHLSIDSVYYQAHRLMYILFMGSDIPAGTEPDHLCRNRWCVNPVDLEPVSHAVNAQRGKRSVLSQDQVDAIRLRRHSGAGVRALAREFGVNHATVSRIVNGHIWPDAPNAAEAVA